MEPIKENILIHMPDDPELFLASWLNVTELQKRRNAEHISSTIYLQGSYDKLKWLFPEDLHWLKYDLSGHIPEAWPKEWDLEIYLDEKRIYEISKPVGLHAAVATGVIMGTQIGLDIYPDFDIKPIEPLQKSTSALVFPSQYYDSESLWAEVAKHYPLPEHFCATILTQADAKALEEDKEYHIGIERSYDMVIGQRSIRTYIACAFARRVIEIYPSDRHKNWMSKWTHPDYRMIYGVEDQKEIHRLVIQSLNGWL